MVHPGVVRLDDDDVSGRVTTHPFGFALLGLRHLPRREVDAIGRELLHPPRHVHDEEIVVRVNGE